MNIVFMGTPEFAVPSLERLVEDGHSVLGVFTQPDKPKGRGYKMVAPPVKEAAISKGIPVFQPDKMRDGEALKCLQELNPELIVVVAYGKILPKDILELPARGCINVHGSLLPKYRGAGPIQWSIINGDERTGITTMYMGEGLDTGDMILKKETLIGENETYGELHDRLAVIGAEALSETVEKIVNGTVSRTPQDDSESCYAPMLNKEIARIDFRQPAKKIHDLICGLSPWPVAYTELEGKLLKIHRAVVVHGVSDSPGKILKDHRKFVVACGDEALELLEVQLQGAKRMSGEDFLRGRKASFHL